MFINPITIKVSRSSLELLIEAAEAHRDTLLSRSLGSTRKAQHNREDAESLYHVLMHIEDAIAYATRKEILRKIADADTRPVS